MIHPLRPHARLMRALDRNAAIYGLTLHLHDASVRCWSSATFTGNRLTLALDLSGAEPAAWLAALPEEDLPVPAHLVADLVVTSVSGNRATLEVLLLEA